MLTKLSNAFFVRYLLKKCLLLSYLVSRLQRVPFFFPYFFNFYSWSSHFSSDGLCGARPQIADGNDEAKEASFPSGGDQVSHDPTPEGDQASPRQLDLAQRSQDVQSVAQSQRYFESK